MKKFFRITKNIIIAFIGIDIFFVVLVQFILTPKFVEKTIKITFQNLYNRKIQINVNSFNIFTGFEFNNIILYNDNNWKRHIFVKIDKLRVKYNLLALFILKLKINDISVINPKINIEYSEKLKKWNFSYFIKPSRQKPKKSNIKSSPFKFHVVLDKFLLKNFSFEMIKNNYIKIRGINIYNSFDIKETTLGGIKKFVLKLYTDRHKNIIIKQKNSTLVMPLNFFININIGKSIKNNIYINYYLHNQVFEMKKKFIKAPNLDFTFKASLNPKKKKLNISTLSFFINSNPFINLKANINNLDANPLFLFQTKPNYFQFSSISRLLQFFLNDSNVSLSGKFSASALKIQKIKDDKFVRFLGVFKIDNFYFKYPKRKLYIDEFNTKIIFNNDKKNITRGNISLTSKEIRMPNIYIKKFNSSIKSLPDKTVLIMKNININDGIFNVSINLKKNKDIKGYISLNYLNLHKFNKQLTGSLSMRNKISGNLNGEILTSLILFTSKFKYNYIKNNNYYYSKNIDLDLSAAAKAYPIKKDIFLNKFKIKISDFFYSELLAKVFNGGQYVKAVTKKSYIDIKKLIKKLPLPLKTKLPFSDIDSTIFNKIYISKNNDFMRIVVVNTNGFTKIENDNAGFSINGFVSRLNLKKKADKIKIDYFFKTGAVFNKLVEYNTNYAEGFKIVYKKLTSTINMDAFVIKKENNINLKYIALNVPDINMSGKIQGKIEDKKLNMDLKFRFNPITNIIFMTNIYLNGKMKLNTKIRSFNDNMLIKGSISFHKFNVALNKLKIKNINGYIPYTHIVQKHKKLTSDIMRESAIKNLEILNYPLVRLYRNIPDNFSIDSITINNLKVDNIKFDLNYERNVVRINKGDFSLLDGSITINKSYFDIADFKYQFNMELTGLNPVKLKNVKLEKGDDTRLFANVRVKGTGPDIIKSSDFYASINITHIGSELATKFLKALDPEGKDSKISAVRNALEKGAQPQLLSFEVRYGLIYSKVWIEESTLYKYILFMIPRLPPSPIIFERKSLEAVLKGIKK